jgi:nucleoside phosphorylase
MGPVRAAIAADRMLERFKMPVLALLGIAGSLTDDALLGDVVVASEVDLYRYAAKAKSPEIEGEFPFDQAGMVWRASPRTLDITRAFRAMPETRQQYEAWRATAAHRLPDGWTRACEESLVRERPELVIGPVASGDIVGAATWFRDQLLARNRKLIAVEMEAAGLAAATESREDHAFLIIRGISDFADERKAALDAVVGGAQGQGAWRRYAVLSAAEFLLRLAPSITERMSPAVEPARPQATPSSKRTGRLQELESELATRYSHRTAIHRVLDYAEVDARAIEEGPATHMWYQALKVASRDGKLRAIVDVALRDYPHPAWPALSRIATELRVMDLGAH